MELRDILKLENLDGRYKDNKGKEWVVIEHSFQTITLREVVPEQKVRQYIEEYYSLEDIVNLTFREVLAPMNASIKLTLLKEEIEVLEEELTKIIDAHIDDKEKIEEKRYQSLLNLRRRLWKLKK